MPFSTSDTYDQTGLSWRQARANCTGLGGDLVSVHSAEENTFVMTEVTTGVSSHRRVSTPPHSPLCS